MKAIRLIGLAVAMLILAAVPAMAQDTGARSYALSSAGIGAGLGAGLCIIGAGWGFGRIGSAALEGMARQPEVAGRIQTAAIIIGALLEGATFFGLIVCYQLVDKAIF